MFSYNTSYHSTIHTTPYELLYGMKPRTPSLPATDIQRKFYGESFASERLQILQKAREIAKANIEKSQEKCKQQHDKKAEPHTFSIGQQVWYSQSDFLNVNKKLAPKWIGPATIIEINESVAKLKLPNNRTKTLNIKRLKLFTPRDEDTQDKQDTQDGKNDAEDSSSNQDSTQINLEAFQNNRPRTRSWAKLINNKAASTLIEEEIRHKLNSIAYKLYHLKFAFEQLISRTATVEIFSSLRHLRVAHWRPLHPARLKRIHQVQKHNSTRTTSDSAPGTSTESGSTSTSHGSAKSRTNSNTTT
jgi:hypothetical protein